MVKNLPCSAGDTGSLPGRGTKIPHAMEQLHAYIHVYMYVFNRNDFLSEMGLFVELSIIL